MCIFKVWHVSKEGIAVESHGLAAAVHTTFRVVESDFSKTLRGLFFCLEFYYVCVSSLK